jgi:regulatory protein
MATTIQRVESVGPDARARRILFEDQSPSRITSAAAVKLLGLTVGSVVDHQELLGELDKCEPQLARERALQLIGYRERSCHELTQRLRDNGYPARTVAGVVSRFCEVELVDDGRFASAWVRSRASAGYGRRRILHELAEKGIDEDTARAAVEEELSGEELPRARATLRGRTPRDAKDRERLIRRLVARGFDVRVALDAVGQIPEVTESGQTL